MRVKNNEGDVPSTKPSFYLFYMRNLFSDTWSEICGQIAPNSREPPVVLNIHTCTAPVYKESITAEKFLKVSV